MTQNERCLYDAIRCRLAPDLLGANFRDRPHNPMYGHCYHSSVALYMLYGGKDAGYAMWKAPDSTGVSHYWLTSPSGETIDPTSEQYTNFDIPLPYAEGKRTGFRVPKVAKDLVNAVRQMEAHGVA